MGRISLIVACASLLEGCLSGGASSSHDWSYHAPPPAATGSSGDCASGCVKDFGDAKGMARPAGRCVPLVTAPDGGAVGYARGPAELGPEGEFSGEAEAVPYDDLAAPVWHRNGVSVSLHNSTIDAVVSLTGLEAAAYGGANGLCLESLQFSGAKASPGSPALEPGEGIVLRGRKRDGTPWTLTP